MKSVFIFFLVFVGLIVGGVYLFLRPKTLGVSFTNENLVSITKKLGVSYEELSKAEANGKTLVFVGSHKVDEVFSSEELTAGVNDRPNKYPYFPFKNVEIRVNADGSIEGVGTVNYESAVNYLVALGVSKDAIIKGTEKFKVPKTNLPLYMQVTGSIENNKSEISVSSIKIAGISIPTDLIEEYTPAFNGFIDSLIEERKPSYNIEKLEVVDGKVHFKGSSPDTEKALRALE